MVVIFMASTGLGRPENSARILDPILQFFNVKNVGAVQIVFRKLGHVTEYSIFALLLSYLLLSRRALRQWWFAIALACIFLYACSDEFHQIFVPERHASMHDVMIDTTSGFVVLSLVAGLRRLFRQREI
jgi:VanZ family protein